ncbi:hypothetical protein BOMU111920_15625 [Bordetella muralis]|jgi:hypothetical protein
MDPDPSRRLYAPGTLPNKLMNTTPNRIAAPRLALT